jgi:hypothetical protein
VEKAYLDTLKRMQKKLKAGGGGEWSQCLCPPLFLLYIEFQSFLML